MATLKEVKVGESAVVARLAGAGALKRRIMDMGLTKGTRVYVRKVAPLGDPMELTVRGYELSIRKDEAASVEVADVRRGEAQARRRRGASEAQAWCKRGAGMA